MTLNGAVWLIILQMKMCQCSHDVIKNKLVKKMSELEKLNIEELKIKKTSKPQHQENSTEINPDKRKQMMPLHG